MYIKNKRGQSTVEYVLLVTAVLAAMIAFATNQKAGLQQQVNTTLTTATGDIGTETDALTRSRHLTSKAEAAQAPGVPYHINVTNGVGN